MGREDSFIVCNRCGGPCDSEYPFACQQCGMTRLLSASDRRARYKAKMRAAGCCEACGIPLVGRSRLCSRHAAAERERSRRSRERRSDQSRRREEESLKTQERARLRCEEKSNVDLPAELWRSWYLEDVPELLKLAERKVK
jgi:hypothetical protein